MSALSIADHAVLVVDLVRGSVSVRGEPIAVTSIEFSTLAVLARQPSRLMSREELMLEVYGSLPATDTRAIDSHLCRLRAKLGTHGDRFILSRYSRGYRLVDAGREHEVSYVGDVSGSPLGESLASALGAMDALGQALAQVGADLQRAVQVERQRLHATPARLSVVER